MAKNYYKYIPFLCLIVISSYKHATYYAHDSFELFFVFTTFMISYISLMFLHEKYLKYKYKELFTRIMSNTKKDNYS